MKRVYLEITDACNLNCPFCTYPKGNVFLTYEQIEDYVGQIKPFCDYLYLHMIGEPLLHPDFDRILDLLDRKEMKLQLVTNGTLLERYPDLTEHSCLRKLSVSLHSISRSAVSDSYFDVIDQLIEKDRQAVLELRFYDREHLDEKLQSYLSLLEKKYPFQPTSKSDSYRLNANTYVYFAKLFEWPSLNSPFISDSGTCHGAIDMIAINSRSEVTLCCLDPEAYNSIGNLEKQKLSQILSSDAYQEQIAAFRSHKIKNALCQRCSYRLRF